MIADERICEPNILKYGIWFDISVEQHESV